MPGTRSNGGRIFLGALMVAGVLHWTAASAVAKGSPVTPPGTVVTQLGGHCQGESIAVQPDGKILVGGVAWSDGQGRFAIVRYLPNGRVDPTFARFSAAQGPLSGYRTLYEGISVLSLQPDGKIVAVGRRAGALLVARYQANGRLDRSFHGTGYVQTHLGSSYRPAAVAIQPDGKIVVAGTGEQDESSSKTEGELVRYEPDGRLDSSFGVGGVVVDASEGLEGFSALRLGADGSILATGPLYPAHRRSALALIRYSPSGRPDSTFGSNGLVTAPFPPLAYRAKTAYVDGIHFLPDGRVVAIGYAILGTGKKQRYKRVAERLDSDGAPDRSLRGNGAAVFGDGSYAKSATGAAPDGSQFTATVWFSGWSGENQAVGVERVSPQGSYHSWGFAELRFGSSVPNPTAIATDGVGRVLIAGSLKDGPARRLFLSRLTLSGHPDRTFGAPRSRLLIAAMEEIFGKLMGLGRIGIL